MNVSRRRFLSGAAAGAAGTALTAGILAKGAHQDAEAATVGQPRAEASYPFHGPHQSGILTPGPSAKQNAACFAAFDVTAANKKELADAMRTLTGRARFLTAGGTPSDLGLGEPPSD